MLLSAAFGGGMSSRLFQRIREEMGLAYTVYSFQSFHGSAGFSGVYVGTRPGWGERVVEAVLEEHRRLSLEGLPEEELLRTKQQVKGQLMLSLESTAARLYRLAGAALREEPYRDLDESLALIDAVSATDVLDAAREFFSPERQFVLMLGPNHAEEG
jgi:predicted Zn-dependent peptidase